MHASAVILAYRSVSNRGVMAGAQNFDGAEKMRSDALLTQQIRPQPMSLFNSSRGAMARGQSIDGAEKIRNDALLTQQIISQPMSLFSSSRGVMAGAQNFDGAEKMHSDALLTQQIRPQPMMSLMNITENLGTIALGTINELLAQMKAGDPELYTSSAGGSDVMYETKITTAQRAVLAEVLHSRGSNLGAFLDVFV
jgi:hypothetical protein